jgi:hypothetical protein
MPWPSAFESIGIQNGGGAGDVTLENKRTLAKLDWNITDDHRATFTYQSTEESKPTPYSGYVKDWSVILPGQLVHQREQDRQLLRARCSATGPRTSAPS